MSRFRDKKDIDATSVAHKLRAEISQKNQIISNPAQESVDSVAAGR